MNRVYFVPDPVWVPPGVRLAPCHGLRAISIQEPKEQMTDSRGNTEIWNLPIPDNTILNQGNFIRHALSNRKSLEGDVFTCLAEDLCIYEVSSLNARKLTEPLTTPFMCLARSSTGTLYALEPPRTLVRLNDDLNWEPCCELRVRGMTPIQGCQDMCFADCKDKEILCILLKSPHCSIVEDDSLFFLEDLSTGYLEHLHTFDRADVLSVAASPYRKHNFPQISFFVWCMDGGLFETPLVNDIDVHIGLEGMTEDEMETVQFIRFSGKRHLYAIGPSGIFHVQLGRGRVHRSIPFASQAIHAFEWERTLEQENRFKHLVDNELEEIMENYDQYEHDDDKRGGKSPNKRMNDDDDDNDNDSKPAKGDMTLTDEFKQRMKVVRRAREAHAKKALEDTTRSKRVDDEKKRKEKEEAWTRLVDLRKAGYESRKKKASEKDEKRKKRLEEDKKKRDAEEAARIAEIEARMKKVVVKLERPQKKEREHNSVVVEKKKPDAIAIDAIWIDEEKDAFSQPISSPEPVSPIPQIKPEVVVDVIPDPEPESVVMPLPEPKVEVVEPEAALSKPSPMMSRFSEALSKSLNLKADAQSKPPSTRKKILVKRKKKKPADDDVFNEPVEKEKQKEVPKVEPPKEDPPKVEDYSSKEEPPVIHSAFQSHRNSIAAISPRNRELTNAISSRASMIISSLPAYLQVQSVAGSARGSIFSLDGGGYNFSNGIVSPRDKNTPQSTAPPVEVAVAKRKRSISTRSYREGSGLLILTDDHVLMKSSWNLSSWSAVATVGGEVQSLTRSSNGVYHVVDIQGNLCTLDPSSGELTMKCTLHFGLDCPVTKVRSLFVSTTIGPLRGRRSFLCCIVPASQIPSRYLVYTDVICSIDEVSGMLSFVHVTSKDDIVACISPTQKVKNDRKGAAFYYWSESYGMYSVHEDCLSPMVPADDAYLPVHGDADAGGRELIPSLPDAIAGMCLLVQHVICQVQNSQLYQRRKSLALTGWWSRDHINNEITSLVFSEGGNLYGAGNCLYGIFIEDGTRGKIADFPDQIISIVWEEEISIDTMDKLSATVGEDGVPFVLDDV